MEKGKSRVSAACLDEVLNVESVEIKTFERKPL